MATYIIKVKNTSGAEGTVIANAGFSYTDKLNEMNEGQLKISGTGEVKRSLFEIGSEVHIYRNGTLEFHGLINSLSYLDAGGIAADLAGYEVWLGKENGDYPNSPYSNTASATIAGHIIGESSKFSSGTIETGENLDFRVEATSSLWNALSSLIKRTAQDIGIDYANTKIDILDHKGNSTSVMTFNDGVQIQDLTVRQSYPVANDVRVYGQGEGNTRIKSNASYGQDAASKSTYGTIRKIYDDPSVTTENEANTLADKLVAKWKDLVKVYEFDVINPNKNLESGDVITLNSSTKGLSNEEVRIVAIDRGIRNSQEFLTLQVTNKEYSTVERGVNKLIAELEKRANDLQTYDQYQDEYANANVPTCIGGNSYICDGAWSIGGKLYYDGSITCLCGIFAVCYGNQYLSFDPGMTVCAPVFQAGSHAGVSSCWSIFSAGIDMCGANIINAGTIYANCFCGPGAGGSNIWADGTDPYIVPCNSCQICVPGIAVTGNICDATSSNCLGIPSSPGAFKEVNAACGMFTTCVGTNTICGGSYVQICNSSGKAAEFGSSYTCLPTIRTKDIYAYANGSCSVGIDACRFGAGYINCMYTCRRLKLPVGTNCY